MVKKLLPLASWHSYLQLLFVFTAFALMVFFAYFSIGNILRNRLHWGADGLLSSAEANVRAVLSEAETTLLNSYYIIRGMIERDASREDILNFLTDTTEWIRRREGGLLRFYGIYAFIHGEFFDTMGKDPYGDFIPQIQTWYQTGVRSGAYVAYTPPFRDPYSGAIRVSAVRNITLDDGSMVGILSLDVNINWLVEYVRSLTLIEDGGGYGILLSQNMVLMAHQDTNVLFYQLHVLGGGYVEIARILRTGGEVFAHEIQDSEGNMVIVFFNRLFNGWFVGIVTPYEEFYRDIRWALMLLLLFGLALSLMLCALQLRLSFAKMRADEESKAKSSFLARMSHEIRTPMNAITGMAELLLRGQLSNEARGYALDIKQAGSNLLSIINDILDFSKIEMNRLEINPIEYHLASLLNDTINIIRARMVEKPLRLFTNIDGAIPGSLVGDEVRLRQILLNLLSNAVKYSSRGHIGLSITQDRREDETVWLKISVSDTGRGIKPEDLTMLFSEYAQFDAKMNRGIEGTGLGLSITRHLCVAMGGDISVESEYNKGSVFTVILPQGIAEPVPFASVEEAEMKKVLVYDRRNAYAKSVCWSLENMGVPHTIVTNHDDFAKAIQQEEWFYVISGHGFFHEKIRPVMAKLDKEFPGRKKTPLALMVEWGTEINTAQARFLFTPVHSLSLADVLNGRAERAYNTYGSGEKIRFTLPDARLLVVDDIPTNLKVAEGLLAPYEAVIDTCTSGAQAIELVKRHTYDIIFMDHMMPDMDGIEAAAAIRDWEAGEKSDLNPNPRQVPIIALTANAVLGMREMFIQNGFNDLLAKPIDVSRLDKVLDYWVPKKKREQKNELVEDTPNDDGIAPAPPDEEFPVIPGVDVPRGVKITGGKIDFYNKVLGMAVKETEERMALMQAASLSVDTLPMFITHAHAIKGVTASVAASEVSSQAAKLEAACKSGNVAHARKEFSDFKELLSKLVKDIRSTINLP
ncbi:MAG: ATP-binding protein [Treponema sp.]|nr:ATP-binding protein [Treponema sp.]MCL2232200.1 ATP-binding protein [Treponema sp.]